MISLIIQRCLFVPGYPRSTNEKSFIYCTNTPFNTDHNIDTKDLTAWLKDTLIPAYHKVLYLKS